MRQGLNPALGAEIADPKPGIHSTLRSLTRARAAGVQMLIVDWAIDALMSTIAANIKPQLDPEHR